MKSISISRSIFIGNYYPSAIKKKNYGTWIINFDALPIKIATVSPFVCLYSLKISHYISSYELQPKFTVVVMVCLCCCLCCMLSTFQLLYGHISVFCILLPQLLLVTTRHAGERKEQGLALQQEQYGCSRYRSFLYSFWSLCFWSSAAASSFVQDSIKNSQKGGLRVSQESLFCSFFFI